MRTWQHVVVAVVVLVLSLLGGFRVLGAGDDSVWRPEHFDAKQVTVQPVGTADDPDGVRIREVVDIDFGFAQRHGYQRIIPIDFGMPTDITAESPDADADVSVVALGSEARIRIGDPNTTYTGRHRYILGYTLPDAQLTSGELNLDIIGTEETFETQRFTVVLTGFELGETRCDTGTWSTFGGCELVRDADGNYVTVIEPLPPGARITVGGPIISLTTPNPPAIPDPPPPVSSGFRPFGFLLGAIGVVVAALVYIWGRWYGSNDVMSGGAVEAAFGALPSPRDRDHVPAVGTYRVPDSRLAELATIEFAPPRGVEPWQGAALLRERVDQGTVSAWFSDMVAVGALDISGQGDDVRLAPGADVGRISSIDRQHINKLFAGRDSLELGTYDPTFTATWSDIERAQRRMIGASGWWTRGGPGSGGVVLRAVAFFVALAVLVAVVAAFIVVSASFGFWRIAATPWLAIVNTVVVTFVTAMLVYSSMFAARSATGSALTLRTESFRRFLVSSEGKHVDWAWQHGLVREYSAWAVALDAADAWSRAIESSNIADPQAELAGPLLVSGAAAAFASSHTAPSSSGGGGGGFSGGGGGGGGGSSGSW